MNELVVLAVLTLISVVGEVYRRRLKVKDAPTQLSLIANIASDVVAAADQYFHEGANDERREWAERAIVDLGKRVGVKLTPDEATAFIHAALRQTRQVDNVEAAFDAGYSAAAAAVESYVEEVGQSQT